MDVARRELSPTTSPLVSLLTESSPQPPKLVALDLHLLVKQDNGTLPKCHGIVASESPSSQCKQVSRRDLQIDHNRILN